MIKYHIKKTILLYNENFFHGAKSIINMKKNIIEKYLIFTNET